MGDGFSLSRTLFDQAPIVKSNERETMERLFQSLQRAEKSKKCRVSKKNAGKNVPNVNFNQRLDLLTEIDCFFLRAMKLPEYYVEDILKCKSNSIHQSRNSLRELSGYTERTHPRNHMPLIFSAVVFERTGCLLGTSEHYISLYRKMSSLDRKESLLSILNRLNDRNQERSLVELSEELGLLQNSLRMATKESSISKYCHLILQFCAKEELWNELGL